ncbi:MAG TPA: transketolase C-terminal domain-containing protein [Desulfitobacteriaceae bacterium]|nr:transketolase C-terminal domain-containing protein [Desulfitobacteriaceae bacterium]
MEILAKVHAHNLVKWAQNRPDVLVLSADLTGSTEIDLFRDAYPERFFSMGIAEQNMLSFAGGLAREGFKPFIHTFAVFIYRRAYDQIAMSVAYPNLPVKMIGFLPGVMTPGGASHQAIEDIALMRSLPNMTILECGDATDVESVLDVADQVNGPVYVRMLRGEIPRLFPQNSPLKFNRARQLSKGRDIALFSSGICTEEALRAVQVLQKHGVSVNHMHITTLKPFNDPAVMEAVAEAEYGIITMENHLIIGGLGSILAELIAEAGLGRKLVRIGIKDVFLHGASKAYLMKEYGLDALALIAETEKLLDANFGIQESDLAAVYLAPVHSVAKAEAL